MASHHSIVILSHSDVQWFELTFTIALISFNYFHCPLDYFKFGWCKKFSQNQGLWLVESSESWLLIGREDSLKIFKGGTLTILKCATGRFLTFLSQWSKFEVAPEWLNWHRSGWSGSLLTNWQSIGIIGNEFCLSGRELVRVTLQWWSGTELDYCNRIKFISMVRSSAVSLYKGKRPRTGPQRWSSTIETGSHQMNLYLSSSGVATVTQE